MDWGFFLQFDNSAESSVLLTERERAILRSCLPYLQDSFVWDESEAVYDQIDDALAQIADKL